MLPKKQRNQSKKPRGYAAFRQSVMQRGRSQTQTQPIRGRGIVRRGRGRGSIAIDRVEMLSQHTKIVEELHEEDLARGLTITSQCKTVRDKNLKVLSKGNSQVNHIFIILM